MDRGYAWLDTGTPNSLLDASNFIATMERRQGLKIDCMEEVTFRMGYIDKKQFKEIIERLPANDYKKYLEMILKEEKR